MKNRRNKQTSILKYAVLKPNSVISSLRDKFRRPLQGCGFEVAEEGEEGVRRYRVPLEALDRFVQDCQWRLDQNAPIIRCLYLDLAPPAPCPRLTVEVYVQHLALPLSKMDGLITPQAFYLVQQSLQGFRALWQKTGAVGLSDQGVGLDCRGECRVWLNKTLSLSYPQEPIKSKPWEIALELIRLVQGRSEPAAHALLARLKDKISNKQPDFKEIGVLLDHFGRKWQVKVPDNLKYLVYQHRLRMKVESLSSISGSRELIKPPRIPSFLPRRESIYTEKPFTPKFKGRKIMGQRHMSALQTSIRRIAHPSIYSSVRPDQLNFSLLETSKRLRLSNGLTISVQKPSKQSLSRCKSKSFESIGLKNSLSPNNNSRCQQNCSAQQIPRGKRQSSYSDNSLTKVSIMSRSKLSSCSIYDLSTAKRLHSKCSYIETPFNQLADLKSETESESGGYSSKIIEEPTTPKLPNRAVPQEGPTFHIIPEAEQIILRNKWTTTLRNLDEHETKMNISIVEGRDTSVYLADVRLEKLERLTCNLAASLSSRGSEVK